MQSDAKRRFRAALARATYDAAPGLHFQL